MIKGVSHAHLGPIWYHSDPSDKYPLFPKPVTGHELFFADSYSKPALPSLFWDNSVNFHRALELSFILENKKQVKNWPIFQ